MKCAIMQPHYMPWSGYFNLIASVDKFVFYDDVQFEKQSWQNRNRILLNHQSFFITVPSHREHLEQPIHLIRIEDGSNWREKQIRLLQQTYAKHPFSSDMLEIAKIVLDKSNTLLADLDIKIIEAVCSKLGLSKTFVRSSSLNILGDRSDRLINICKALDCDEYLSPPGSRDYIEEDGKFRDNPIKLRFQNFEPQPYVQKNEQAFVSHLSFLDVVANLGWAKTLDYITPR